MIIDLENSITFIHRKEKSSLNMLDPEPLEKASNSSLQQKEDI